MTPAPQTVDLAASRQVELLEPPSGKVRAVIDTDTFNEVDDQFAVAWALLSPEQLSLEALYAAPFIRLEEDPIDGIRTPGQGMEASFGELQRVAALLGGTDVPILQGSSRWLSAESPPETSEVTEDLIERALSSEEPLYVLTLGAPTNVASAVLAEPAIAERVVVVWLGGNPWYWPDAMEFNVYQDLLASHVLLDSGVPLVHVPCVNVTEHLRTSEAELDRFVRGCGEIGAYLTQIYRDYLPDHFGRSKEIWDLGPIAWAINPDWVPSGLIQSRELTGSGTWNHRLDRHLIREATAIDRDAIFADLFQKLADHGGGAR